MPDTVNSPEKNTSRLEQLLAVPVESRDLLADLTPPKHFKDARFDNYAPEPAYPSQELAREKVQRWVHAVALGIKPGLLRKLVRGNARHRGTGIYLDGGFGVGKTHLLAGAYHAFHGKKAYLSFQELMFLVGLITLEKTAQQFSSHGLVVIDEFELDDPANTRIATNLLGRLFGSGVSIITSSNTPPGALGIDKFSIEQFRRELGELTSNFESIRIDGEDYRMAHRAKSIAESTWVCSKAESESLALLVSLDRKARHNPKHHLQIEFSHLLRDIATAHPIRVRKAVADLRSVEITDVRTIDHPHEALRFVYLVDKLYDNDVALYVHSEVPISHLFHSSLHIGGDTKKYLRTLSRLEEMTSLTAEREFRQTSLIPSAKV